MQHSRWNKYRHIIDTFETFNYASPLFSSFSIYINVYRPMKYFSLFLNDLLERPKSKDVPQPTFLAIIGRISRILIIQRSRSHLKNGRNVGGKKLNNSHQEFAISMTTVHRSSMPAERPILDSCAVITCLLESKERALCHAIFSAQFPCFIA